MGLLFRFLNGLQCLLAPGEEQLEALFEIEFGALVHGNGMFQHGLVFAAEQLDQFSLSADELAVSQVMEILEYEEYTLKRAGQAGFAGFGACMDVLVADLVVQIADAELDEISDVMLCEDGDKGPQLTIIVFGAVQKMTDFQGVPFC